MYGNKPLNSQYLNFEAFLLDSDIMLIEDETKVTKRAGRPTQAAQAMKDLIDPTHQYELDDSIKNDIDQNQQKWPEKTDLINNRAGNKD